MLRSRVLSALILLSLVAGPVVVGGLIFFSLVLLVGLIAAWEYVQLLRQGGHRPILPLVFLLIALLISQAQWPAMLPIDVVMTLTVAGSLMLTLWHRGSQPATDWALTLGGGLYLGWLLNHFVRLRALPDGLFWLLSGAATIWVADAAAYFAGRAYGRHPWWPRHSPHKTWEGYLSGIVAGTLTAALLCPWLLGLKLWESACLGLLISVLAPLGDLAESMLKRQVGAKDSSPLIPGHGGILDRIDSLLIAIPLVFYWATLRPW